MNVLHLQQGKFKQEEGQEAKQRGRYKHKGGWETKSGEEIWIKREVDHRKE